MVAWTPSSWREKPITQDVTYPDAADHARVVRKLKHLPPLVSTQEIDSLAEQMADVAAGKAFLLQGGDCAELFDYCSETPIEHKLSLILIMSLILLNGAHIPIVRIMRIAGQYAKPRSKPTEMVDMPDDNGQTVKKEVLSFRGDNVNGYDMTERAPDPDRLVAAYFHSAATLNYIRTLLSSGFADLHKPLEWSFSYVRNPELQKQFENVVENLQDRLEFMKVATGGAGGSERGGTRTVNIFTSHEALLLEYEEAFTRSSGFVGPSVSAPTSRPTTPGPSRSASIARGERSPASSGVLPPKRYYNTSAHFIWIGDRTRQLDGAHIEYFRGIANPIGVKVGPGMQPDELVRMLDILNPDRVPGKVTLISRYGAAKVDEYLPAHIDAVKATDHVVVWQCDPMHGNTKTSTADASLKTRHFSDVMHEITRAFEIHREKGTVLGGIHLELTGELNDEGYSVTECIGGSMELEDKDLSLNYRTHCDPRLNYEQSLDVAFQVSDYLAAAKKGRKPRDLFKAARQ
ncbi:DAHP synthetase [Cutaneotrichosporon oleaginosum]|uniref:Phospho-2-dehydro-3-deoxyheptonate aldolase n=1 Tax=Cutaneotrichosporon oleaginosum TaxID=879819 RepID=A0A0J0XTQ6_9TREE|nr:DAHP synthetase [Cutaneotrichosporon oleaginosum]KLT44447.1 DAHP synthetase [Cutaneotrichosporon oleaginosum]TXT07834.1 hypothetical protein COLE_04758 [Cutaneotrichosporon oleaginosum]